MSEKGAIAGREPIGVEVKGPNRGYRTGAGVRMTSGEAAGRQMYCLNHGGDFFFCEGHGEANLLRFTGRLTCIRRRLRCFA